ncbi:NINE protein [Planktothrix agardhii]|uniref:NINE protein n=1 Tax=Planktothrix agardhii TaxID=1160 RepID=UPI0020A76517|nr:NINE protein [Planktothrix agardhii]CAD5980235.1 putative membrane protein YozV [Planktothrix agardhii]
MKNKFLAALIAFFLGAFGIHKFYLGENFGGILYFLFSWTFIPAILAFFDFMSLLLMSDQTFDARFNPGLNTAVLRGSHSREDVTIAISQLKKLYDQDAITAEEYEEKRRKLLNEL